MTTGIAELEQKKEHPCTVQGSPVTAAGNPPVGRRDHTAPNVLPRQPRSRRSSHHARLAGGTTPQGDCSSGRSRRTKAAPAAPAARGVNSCRARGYPGRCCPSDRGGPPTSLGEWIAWDTWLSWPARSAQLSCTNAGNAWNREEIERGAKVIGRFLRQAV